MLAGVLMPGAQPDIGRQRARALEAGRITKLGDKHGGGAVPDAGYSGQQFADLVLFELAGDLHLELFKPCAESLQIFARVAHSGLVARAMLTADRDRGGINQLLRKLSTHLVATIVTKLRETLARETAKGLSGGILTKDRVGTLGV